MSQPDSNSTPPPTVVKATLTALPDGNPVTVHFNPSSLVYTLQNSSPQQGGDPKRRQHAAQFSGKLTMDLQFDTTNTGADVRTDTSLIALMMQPANASNQQSSSGNGTNQPAPPVVSFDWGVYQFQGVLDSFKETIDFFSADGIPLRSLVSIGLTRQDQTLSAVPDIGQQSSQSSLVPTAGDGADSNDETSPGSTPSASGTSLTAIATQGGDPNATRALASANNIENPRFTGGATLEVSSGIQLNPAVGFVASASAGAGASGGLGLSLTAGAGVSGGIGVSAGIGISGGAGVSSGVSLGIGASVSSNIGGQVTLAAGGGALFGSTASAGVPATMGAFAGLETGRATVSTTAQLNPLQMLPSTVGSDVSASAGASFGLGGIALAQTGFSSNVGASTSITDRLTFDGD